MKDLAGCNLIWRDNDITTAVYSFWGDICDYNGNILATAALGEGDYIYDLAFQDGGARLAVTIESGGGEGSTAVIDLPA